MIFSYFKGINYTKSNSMTKISSMVNYLEKVNYNAKLGIKQNVSIKSISENELEITIPSFIISYISLKSLYFMGFARFAISTGHHDGHH